MSKFRASHTGVGSVGVGQAPDAAIEAAGQGDGGTSASTAAPADEQGLAPTSVACTETEETARALGSLEPDVAEQARVLLEKLKEELLVLGMAPAAQRSVAAMLVSVRAQC